MTPAPAAADETPLAARVQRLVEDGLLKPLADRDRETDRFSRARLPPRERRVRVTQATPSADKNGRAFVAFAVDVRFGKDDWHENDIVGCAYTANGEILVKKGDAYRPAAFLLGKNVDPVPGACEAVRARA